MTERLQYWCLHCETVFSTDAPADFCLVCGAHCLDLSRVGHGLLDPVPDHWPADLEDFKRYPLYE